MAAPYFSRALVKAVNDWQAGSVGKRRKATAISKAITASPLDASLTACDVQCYRRSVLTKSAVTQMFFEFEVSEETSSWTTRRAVAAQFRGGPPDPPDPGVIFAHTPKPDEVILNLERLYEHPEFRRSVDHWADHGLRVDTGILRYGSSQAEVVLNVDKVLHTEIFAFGSNSVESAEMAFGLGVIGDGFLTPEEVEANFRTAGVPTRRWIFDDGVERIYRNWIDNVLKRVSP